MNGRYTSLRDALIFRSIHFWCKMNCYTESFFLNCSLIAPSRLSDCMFIYCSIAPPWFILFYTFPLLIFPFCPSSSTNMKNFLVSQGALTTFWRALSLGSVFPACDKQTGASPQPSSRCGHLQHGFSRAQRKAKCGDQTRTITVFQRNCRMPRSQNLWCDHRWLL